MTGRNQSFYDVLYVPNTTFGSVRPIQIKVQVFLYTFLYPTGGNQSFYEVLYVPNTTFGSPSCIR